jgi:hypothetical protein
MNIRPVIFVIGLFGALIQFGSVRAEGSLPGAEWDHATPATSGWYLRRQRVVVTLLAIRN